MPRTHSGVFPYRLRGREAMERANQRVYGERVTIGIKLLQGGESSASGGRAGVGGRSGGCSFNLGADHASFDRAEAANAGLVPVHGAACSGVGCIARKGCQTESVATLSRRSGRGGKRVVNQACRRRRRSCTARGRCWPQLRERAGEVRRIGGLVCDLSRIDGAHGTDGGCLVGRNARRNLAQRSLHTSAASAGFIASWGTEQIYDNAPLIGSARSDGGYLLQVSLTI
jgi:hypothetical protein